jgi:hypothetical protein
VTTVISSKLASRLQGLPRTLKETNRSLQLLGSLRDLGWQRSVGRGVPLDDRGEPLAWYTYPCLAWLEPRLSPGDRVFEFGAGGSTLWYGRRVAEVVAVEHDSGWLARLAPLAGPNVELLQRPARLDEVGDPADPSVYVEAIGDRPTGHFDLVAVDGMERLACIEAAIPHLRADGLIVLDNSDRPHLRPGIDRLDGLGFGRIDFLGFHPAHAIPACTSVFSRSFDRWLRGAPAVRFFGL